MGGHRGVQSIPLCSTNPRTSCWRLALAQIICRGVFIAAINILIYWKVKENTWPNLAAVARGLLGVPATSTPSERSFSVAGRTIEDRRTMLSAESIDGLLFLHGL